MRGHSISRSLTLNCPSCAAPIEDGTAICPSCDYIIDSSFLDADAGGTSAPKGDSTNVGPAPQRPAPVRKPSAAPRPRPRTGAPRAARPAPARPAPRIPTPADAPAEEPVYEPVRYSSAYVQNTTGSARETPEDALRDVGSFVRQLSSADKLAFVGAMITVVVSFFPWKETAADGEVLGVMSLAFPVFVGAVIVITSIVARVRELIPRMNSIFPWLAQLGCSCFGILWTLVFIKVSWNGTEVRAPVGNLMMAVSSPSMGALAGLMGCVVAAAGTLMGLKEKPA